MPSPILTTFSLTARHRRSIVVIAVLLLVAGSIRLAVRQGTPTPVDFAADEQQELDHALEQVRTGKNSQPDL